MLFLVKSDEGSSWGTPAVVASFSKREHEVKLTASNTSTAAVLTLLAAKKQGL